MHEYQLDRLNTRSFEQLVQSLGTAIIGPRLMVFGDGPDGGREATFDGLVKYEGLSKAWKGYGIVQAKFRQQPDSEARKNADWVIQQLKAEFAKFKPRPRRPSKSDTRERVCPDYYVFATNLPLSPVLRKGGKDRVRAVLEGFRKSHGLKDYAIWDQDQIRRFLDAQPGIRTTYAAWLLPGDVLMQIIDALDLGHASFPSTIRRYLESELLDDQFAKLGQGGYTDAKNIPLSSVFVDLPLESHTRERREPSPGQNSSVAIGSDDVEEGNDDNDASSTFLRSFFAESAQVLRPSVLNRQSPHGRESTRRHGRLVLIGGPGQGKTTLGQYACQLLRTALLRGTDGPYSPEVSQALDRLDEMSRDLPPVTARRYPLRIDLKHFASSLAAGSEDGARTLFDYLLKRVGHRTNTKVNPVQFRRWLEGYPWALILDGLDEVPASSNRDQVMQAIRDFISVEAQYSDADLLVLATTRPQGYSDEFDPAFYRHMALAPLGPEEALGYGEKLATARHPGQPSRVEDLTASLRRATQNSATVRLMQSPLQVTIMLALIEGGGEPPEQRWKLFRDYYDVIYRREKERGTPFSAILGRYEPDVHWIHHRAGWLLQQRNAATGKTDARFSHGEFEQLVDARLKKSGHQDTRQRNELVQAIRLAATDRLVLLVGNTEKEIGFEIRSLQEFMAAEHIFDGGESSVYKTLHLIGPYGYWRNVFLFAAGRIFFERRELIDTVIAVCSQMNELPNDVAQQATLAGSRLALAVLRDGAARNQPASERALARIGERCLDCHDEDAVKALAELFHGEAEEMWKKDLLRRLNTSDTTVRWHNWLLCLELVGSRKEWAIDLFEERFPWNAPQAVAFIETLPEVRRLPSQFWMRFEEHAVTYPPKTIVFLHRRQRDGVLKAGGLRDLYHRFDLLTETESWPFECGSKPCGMSIAVKGSATLRAWSKWTYPDTHSPLAHPAWRVFEAAAAFGRMPTLASLHLQLSVVAEADLLQGVPLRLLPWQFGVCLQARLSGLTWDEILSKVEGGSLGLEADWARWEAENRVHFSLAKCRKRDQLIVSDDSQGAIVAVSSWLYSFDAEVVPFLSELSAALRQWNDIRDVDTLINLCCFAIGRLDREPMMAAAEAFVDFVETCSELKIPLTEHVVMAILTGPMSVDDKRNLLGKIGSTDVRTGWVAEWRQAEASRAFETIWEDVRPGEVFSLLRAVSFLPPVEGLDTIPDQWLKDLRAAGEDSRRVAVKLQIDSLRWNESESAELAREAIALESVYPRHLDSLLDFIESSIKRGPHLETFLVELLKLAAPELEGKLRSRITSLLVKLVERRPAVSDLPDPEIRLRAAEA